MFKSVSHIFSHTERKGGMPETAEHMEPKATCQQQTNQEKKSEMDMNKYKEQFLFFFLFLSFFF